MPYTVKNEATITDKTDHSCVKLAEHKLNLFCDKSQQHKLNLFCDKSQDDISVCEKIDIQPSTIDKDKSRDMNTVSKTKTNTVKMSNGDIVKYTVEPLTNGKSANDLIKNIKKNCVLIYLLFKKYIPYYREYGEMKSLSHPLITKVMKVYYEECDGCHMMEKKWKFNQRQSIYKTIQWSYGQGAMEIKTVDTQDKNNGKIKTVDTQINSVDTPMSCSSANHKGVKKKFDYNSQNDLMSEDNTVSDKMKITVKKSSKNSKKLKQKSVIEKIDIQADKVSKEKSCDMNTVSETKTNTVERKMSVKDRVAEINKIEINKTKNNLKTSRENISKMKDDKDIKQSTQSETENGEEKTVEFNVFPLKFKRTDKDSDFKYYTDITNYNIREYVNLTKMNFVVENYNLIPVNESTSKMKEWLKWGKLDCVKQFHEKILLSTEEDTGILKSKFFKTPKYEELIDDRVYPIANISLSHIGNRRWPVRSFMLDGEDYVDIDIVNCQPNEIRALMKYAKMPTSKYQYINEYCENRDKIMKKVPDIKSLLISILFGGDSWRLDEELNEEANQQVLELMENIDKEVKTHIIPTFKKMYPELYNPKLKEGYDKKKSYADDEHLFLASVLRQVEYRLLCFSFVVLKKIGFITEDDCPSIPCHDGFLLNYRKNTLDETKQDPNRIVRMLNKFVKKVLKLDFIEWIVKKPKANWQDKMPKRFVEEWEKVKDIEYRSKLKDEYGLTKETLYDKLKENGCLYNTDYTSMFLHKHGENYVVVKGDKGFDKCLTRNQYGLLDDVKDTVLTMEIKEHFTYMRRLLGEHYNSDTNWDYILQKQKLPKHLLDDKSFMKLFQKIHDKEGPVNKIEMLFGNMSCGGVNFNCIQRLIKEKMVDTNFHNEMNKNSMVIGFTNGVFDLTTGKLRNALPSDKQVFNTGYNYTFTGNGQAGIFSGIERRLKTIFCDKNGKYNEEKYNWCMEQFGLCLCGEQLDKFGEYYINLYGGGGNGKSAIQESFIGAAFGNYCQEIPTKLMNEEHTTRSPELMRLVNARFVIINEPDAHDREGCRTNTIKKFTGGTITVRDNFAKADEVESIRLNRIWLSMNKPMKYKIQKDLDAMKRRIRGIHLYRKFTDDPLKHDENNPLSVLSTPEDKEFILRCKNDELVKSVMIYILWEHLQNYMKKTDEEKTSLPQIIKEETDYFVEQSIHGNDEYDFIRKPTVEEVKNGKSYAMDIRTIRKLVNSKTSKSYALRTVEEWLNSNYGVVKDYRKHNLDCSTLYEAVGEYSDDDYEANELNNGDITGFHMNCNKYRISYVRKKRKVVQHVILRDEEGEYLPLYDGNKMKNGIVKFQYVKTDTGTWNKYLEGTEPKPKEEPKEEKPIKKKKVKVKKGKVNVKIKNKKVRNVKKTGDKVVIDSE